MESHKGLERLYTIVCNRGMTRRKGRYTTTAVPYLPGAAGIKRLLPLTGAFEMSVPHFVKEPITGE